MEDETTGTEPAKGAVAESPPAEEATPVEEDSTPPEDKRSHNAEKRIGQLVAEREYWRGKAEIATKIPASPTPAPTPKKELNPSDFNSDSDYLKAVATQTRDEIRAEFAAERARSQQQTTAAEAQKALSTARSKHADFDVVALNPTLPVTQAMVDAATGDNYGEILYALGSEPEEARRISSLTTVQQIKEIGKIESRLNSKPKPKTSNAPTPPKTVSGGGGSPTPKTEKDMSFAEKKAKWGTEREEAIRKRYGQ